MKSLFLALCLVFLAGCATTYELTADPVSGKITALKITSRREFENGLQVKYDKETGSFQFQAGSVTTGESPLEVAAAQLMLMLPGILTAAPVP